METSTRAPRMPAAALHKGPKGKPAGWEGQSRRETVQGQVGEGRSTTLTGQGYYLTGAGVLPSRGRQAYISSE